MFLEPEEEVFLIDDEGYVQSSRGIEEDDDSLDWTILFFVIFVLIILLLIALTIVKLISNWKAARRNSQVESIPMIDDSENLKTFNIKSCESDRNEKTMLKTTEEEEK